MATLGLCCILHGFLNLIKTYKNLVIKQLQNTSMGNLFSKKIKNPLTWSYTQNEKFLN